MTRARKHRRALRQFLKSGKAPSAHKLVSGRTGSVWSKKLASRRTRKASS